MDETQGQVGPPLENIIGCLAQEAHTAMQQKQQQNQALLEMGCTPSVDQGLLGEILKATCVESPPTKLTSYCPP